MLNKRLQQEPSKANLRIETVTRWVKDTWMAQRPEYEWVIVPSNMVCMDESILDKFDEQDPIILDERYIYRGSHNTQADNFPVVYSWVILEGELTQRTGAFIYEFEAVEHAKDNPPFEVLMLSYYINDNQHQAHLACIPRPMMPVWAAFIQACQQVRHPQGQVRVIGGNQNNYEPRVHLDDIIMEETLKQSILDDVDKFFRRGVGIYRKMNLNPFRKILLAGVPGTGKTMLCNALANWAIARDYEVLYISGADARGANFFKIQQALAISANAKRPTLILLEEIDSFLNDKQKSMILNVLDGVESFENEFGTMLIATTNYPEAIDERVLKRPGRLDRIYIVPPAQSEAVVEQMLRIYLGDMWQDEHRKMSKRLVDYPGAFIREVVVFAMTQAIDVDLDEDMVTVPLALLEESFDRLKSQIKARDTLIDQNPTGRKFGFAARSNGTNGNGSH
ncbi:MAG: ATP-binding protein [Phototrophicaceae bacterium]